MVIIPIQVFKLIMLVGGEISVLLETVVLVEIISDPSSQECLYSNASLVVLLLMKKSSSLIEHGTEHDSVLQILLTISLTW